MPEPRYAIEIHLKSGGVLHEDVTEAQADDLVATGRFAWPGERDQDWKRRSAVTTVLAERLERGTGLLSITDADGAQWLVRADNISAIRVRDRREAPDSQAARRWVGYEPPVTATSD
jgi:hypothetical protein